MPILTITTAGLKRLCAIDAGDTSQDDDLAALIIAEQEAREYALDPAVLTASAGDAGLSAALVLGMAECLAGSYLEQVGRTPGMTDDFRIGGLDVTASRTDNLAQLAARLQTRGLARLEPFARAAKRVAYDAVAGVGDGASKVPTLGILSATGSVFDRPFERLCEEGT